MNLEREYIIRTLTEEVPGLTVKEATIIFDSLVELLNRSIRIGHDVKLIGLGGKAFIFRAAEADLSPSLVH